MHGERYGRFVSRTETKEEHQCTGKVMVDSHHEARLERKQYRKNYGRFTSLSETDAKHFPKQ